MRQPRLHGTRGGRAATAGWRLTWVVAALALAALATGCSTTESPDAQCLAAFRNAEPRAEPPYRVSPLDDAIRACADVGAWRRAWDAVPGAHPDEADPMAFLADRCRLDELQATALCRSFDQ